MLLDTKPVAPHSESIIKWSGTDSWIYVDTIHTWVDQGLVE